MLIKLLLFLFVALVSPVAGAGGAAAAVMEIKLLVNGKPISNFDIEQQARMLIVTSNIKSTRENLARARERAEAQLVDNILRSDVAREKNISATKEEVEKTIRQGLQEGDRLESFIEFLKKNNVRPENFYRHMEAQLLWNKYIQREIVPRIIIPQGQIDQQMMRIKTNLQQKTFLLSQIVLRFDNLAQEEKIRTLAGQLKQQLNAGADFASLARNYSQGRVASRGGDLGWVAETNLPEKLQRVVVDMKVRTISPVIRLPDGYYVLWLREVRKPHNEGLQKTMFDLKIVRVPLSLSAKKIKNKMPACIGADEYVESIGGEVEPMGLMAMTDLSPSLQKKLSRAKKNDLIPIARGEGIQEFILLCDRIIQNNPQLSLSRVQNQLLSARAFVRARQELRNLRRNASIEKK